MGHPAHVGTWRAGDLCLAVSAVRCRAAVVLVVGESVCVVENVTPRQILRLRGSLGMTQIQFALLLGTHSTTISRWESELSKIKPTTWQLSLLNVIAIGNTANPDAADRAMHYLYNGDPGRALGCLLGAAI